MGVTPSATSINLRVTPRCNGHAAFTTCILEKKHKGFCSGYYPSKSECSARFLGLNRCHLLHGHEGDHKGFTIGSVIQWSVTGELSEEETQVWEARLFLMLNASE